MRSSLSKTLFVLALCLLFTLPKVRACDNDTLILDSVEVLGPGHYKFWMTICAGGGFTMPNIAGANNYVTDFYFEVFGSGAQILQKTTPNDDYYPDFLNSGQASSGCTNCRNACATWGSIGNFWMDPSCTEIAPPIDTTCYGCPGPSNVTHCPALLPCPNGPGTCIWYSSNDPCCNGAWSSSPCNNSGYNYFSFWAVPFKPQFCPGPANSGASCKTWSYIDIWNGSGPAAAYCDTVYLEVTGCLDSIALRGIGGSGIMGSGCNLVIPKSVISASNNMSCSSVITGKIWNDLDSNCVDSAEGNLGGWLIKAFPGPFYATSDSLGFYKMPVPEDTFSIVEIVKKHWKNICPAGGSYTAILGNPGDSSNNNDFGNTFIPVTEDSCMNLWLDIGSPQLIKCSKKTYVLQYCNLGNIMADPATIIAEFDSLLTIDSTSIPAASASGGSLKFVIDSLYPGSCGTIHIYVSVDCNSASLGAYQCAKAAIYPGDYCGSTDTVWDKSSISVTGSCLGSQACFVIKNNGSPFNGNMQGASEYRVYFNNILTYKIFFQLMGGDSLIVCWPAYGNTIKLEADQRPGHPGKSKPNAIVNLCGGIAPGSQWNFNTPIDSSDNEDIDCKPILMPVDPNNKIAAPMGLTANHYIDSNQILEYQINFQNTGSDTAHDVWIRDTLSPYLSIPSVVSGVSSHNYIFQIYGNGILEWYFPDIMLPDSNVNEPASHGFVKFEVMPVPGLTEGTKIENWADIYFDFELPVRTDSTFHIVYDTLLISRDSDPLRSGSGLEISVFPNPAENSVTILCNDPVIWQYEFLDLTGRAVRFNGAEPGTAWIRGRSKIEVELKDLPGGVFIWVVRSGDGRQKSGKLVKM